MRHVQRHDELQVLPGLFFVIARGCSAARRTDQQLALGILRVRQPAALLDIQAQAELALSRSVARRLRPALA